MRGAALRLLRTQAFRIVLIYAVLFALSVTALLGFTYWKTGRSLDAATDQTIQAERDGLLDQYQNESLRGLYESVNSRPIRNGPNGQAIYLLASRDHRVMAGNLTIWPELRSSAGNYVEFDFVRDINGAMGKRHARGLVVPLEDGGMYLLVAEDVTDRDLTQRMFTTTLPWTVCLILLLGLAGGALMSRNMLRRLDAINRTSGEIIAGDLSRRVPVTGAADEFDVLAENLNRMLDRIERLMKGLREVTDSVAHDLRTPLNRLRNRLEESLARLTAAGNNAGEIERAIAETDMLIATFNALLLIAETDAGAGRAQMTMLDLASVARDATELYEPLAEDKGIALSLACAPGAQIEGNRSLVAQALANLLDNAIKYTPPGGSVTVKVAAGSEGLALCVADSGPGIAVQDRARVVERFVRLEESRNSPGTGLGLSLVAAVAHFHGTQLVLEDNAPGLRASLTFPRAVADGPHPRLGRVVPMVPAALPAKNAAE